MPNATSVYVNPIPSGVAPNRLDQGADFTGNGQVRALGDGVVIETQGGGWPGGPFMSYRLTNGPAAGKVVYIAEEITPLVRTGEHVSAGQPVARMHGFIETGWADSTGTTTESQTAAGGHISGGNLPGGGANPTKLGKNFDQLLVRLGAKKAPNFNNPTGGNLPPGYPNWGNANLSGVGGNLSGTSSSSGGGITSDIFGGIAGDLFNPIASSLGVSSLSDFIQRGLLIFLGTVFVLIGIWKIASPTIEKRGGEAAETAGAATGQPELIAGGAVAEQRGEKKQEKHEPELDEPPF